MLLLQILHYCSEVFELELHRILNCTCPHDIKMCSIIIGMACLNATLAKGKYFKRYESQLCMSIIFLTCWIDIYNLFMRTPGVGHGAKSRGNKSGNCNDGRGKNE